MSESTRTLSQKRTHKRTGGPAGQLVVGAVVALLYVTAAKAQTQKNLQTSNVNSGDRLLSSPSPKIIYEHLVSESVCAGRVESRIIYIPGVAAVLVREKCSDTQAQTLQPAVYGISSDQQLLTRATKLYQKKEGTADVPDWLYEVYCEGGRDRAGRAISVKVRRQNGQNNGQMNGQNLQILMALEDDEHPESYTFWVQMQIDNRKSIYQTGPATTNPYLKLILANLNGLTGYLSFNFQRPGSRPQAYAENNISFASCLNR